MSTQRIVSSEKNWIEGEAVRQLERSAGLAGMAEVVGLPDLQPGKGYPVGAVFASRDVLYPYLVGNDIGCGVSLWQTDLLRKKFKIDRFRKRVEANWDEFTEQAENRPEPTPFDAQLGSMGGGNHFAEVQGIESVMQPECFSELGLAPDRLIVLVHSGSRGLGEAILRQHVERYRDEGLSANSPEANEYFSAHCKALSWAKANRELIATSMLDCLGAASTPVLDLPHNFIAQEEINGESLWLHRKGAVSAREGVVMIPGSRGSLTYLVRPTGEVNNTLFSLPHGAGRKWQRGDCRGKLEKRFRAEDLCRTSLGGQVLCPDKDLLYEEAPQAYKDIDTVIDSLLAARLIEVIATLRPLATVKRGKQARHG